MFAYGQFFGTTAAAAASAYNVATGGTVTYDGDYKVHKFTGSGSFVVSATGALDDTVEYMIVAGGGGCGQGGGGAGGYLVDPSYIVTAQTYAITVGDGGTSEAGTAGGVGEDSEIIPTSGSTITADGGGPGAYYNDGGSTCDGGSGGGGRGGIGIIISLCSVFSSSIISLSISSISSSSSSCSPVQLSGVWLRENFPLLLLNHGGKKHLHMPF